MVRIKHVVLLRIRPDESAERIAALFTAIADLRRYVPEMLDFSAGGNVSPEGLARGFTHGLAITFASAAGRDAYLAHPAHDAVKEHALAMLDGGVDGVLVLDWEAE